MSGAQWGEARQSLVGPVGRKLSIRHHATLFFLVAPEPVRAALAGQADVLALHYGGKATRPETIHLTLAFLGEVDESLLPVAIRAAQTVSGRPFELTVDRLGYWRHNRLLWAGCASRKKELQMLVGKLREQLRAASICCDERHPLYPPPDARAQGAGQA
jgi:RNA 2',3'-cyclic 3'-phosphodiesterase